MQTSSEIDWLQDVIVVCVCVRVYINECLNIFLCFMCECKCSFFIFSLLAAVTIMADSRFTFVVLSETSQQQLHVKLMLQMFTVLVIEVLSSATIRSKF